MTRTFTVMSGARKYEVSGAYVELEGDYVVIYGDDKKAVAIFYKPYYVAPKSNVAEEQND